MQVREKIINFAKGNFDKDIFINSLLRTNQMGECKVGHLWENHLLSCDVVEGPSEVVPYFTHFKKPQGWALKSQQSGLEIMSYNMVYVIQ